MLKQEIFSAAAFAYLVGLGCLSNYLTQHIRVQVLNEISEITNPESFIATRAFANLKALTDFGPRATGSDANEIHVVNFLINRANQIKSEYARISNITINLQVVSGVHLRSANYKDIQNVVVKLQGESDNALMINCHFDSEVGSYGAGDDGVNCCTMLEILRVLAKSGRKNAHSIIFLFNGSEEGNLEGIMASHGFITQHKWAKEIKAYINLEAQGIGGRELLFRTGPKHDWLVKSYRKAVKRPFGQVIAEEMFETNVLSSGTDFESFRDAGGIAGLDIAYANQGWVYHTKFDHIRYMTVESIQNTGNNILDLTRELANSDELPNPPEGSSAVYFDLWGLIFISYTAQVGLIINIAVSILVVAVTFLLQVRWKAGNVKVVMVETSLSLVTFAVGVILSLAACFAMGLIINSADRSMFWFNSTILSLGVYCALAVTVQIAVQHLSDVIRWTFTKKRKVEDKYLRRTRFQAQVNGVNLFWAILAIVFSCMGFRFPYVIMIMLVFSLISSLVIFVFEVVFPKTRLHSWVLVHFIVHSFGFLWTTYLLLTFWKIYLPITAKSYNSNPEIFVSVLCGLLSIFALSFFISLTSIIKSRAIIYSTLLATFILSVILAFTPAGFPFNGSLADPRAQRHYVWHTKRTFFGADGTVRFTDFGFFLKEHDRNTKRTLDSFLDPEKLLAKDKDRMCSTEAFCGFPSYNKTNAFWMQTDQEHSVEPAVLSQTSKTITGNTVEMGFELVSPLLNILFVALDPGVEMIENSSTPFSQYEWVEGKTAHYIKITKGKDSMEPFIFNLTLSASLVTSAMLKVTVVSIDSHFDKSPIATGFQALIDSFPDYTFVQAHQADVSSYTF